MIKVPLCRFQQCFGPFILLLLEGSSETRLSRHLSNNLTTYFGIHNSKNISAMRVMFFSKSSFFDLDLKNANKNPEKVFCLLDNGIWMCCVWLSLLTREHLSSAVNVLTNSPRILHISKRDFIYFNYLHSDH